MARMPRRPMIAAIVTMAVLAGSYDPISICWYARVYRFAPNNTIMVRITRAWLRMTARGEIPG